jgi:hypothetical protein
VPKCEFENCENAKFCSECGHKFEIKCPECGISNRLGAKFCDECGYNLIQPSDPTFSELSFDEKLNKIHRYLPQKLTEKICSQRDKIEITEQKLLHVMRTFSIFKVCNGIV